MKIIDKYNSLSKGMKASLWFTFCSLLQKGISFVATPFYTRLLTKNEYGYFATFSSWQTILTIFATLCLSAGVMNNLLTNKDRFKLNSNQITSNLQFLEIISVVFVSCLLLLINTFFPDLLHFEQKTLLLLCTTIFANSAISLYTTKEKFNFNYKPVVLISIVVSLLIPIVNFLLIRFGETGKFALIYGTTLVSLLVYIPVMAFNIIKGKRVFDFKVWKYALLFNLPLIPHYLSLVILSSSDKIMIERIQGDSNAALYAIPLGIVSLITIFSSSINASLIPSTYQKLKDGSYKTLSKYVTGILLFFSVLSFLLMLFGPEAVFVMGGSEYMEAKWVIPPVAASAFFSFLYPLFANVEFFYENRMITTICSIFAAIFNIILNYVFITMFGYIAAAFTTLTCYIFLSLSHYIAYKILCKKNMIVKMYNEKAILLFCILNLSFVGISYILYLNTILRYVFGGLLIIGVLLSLKKIIKLIYHKEEHI